MEELQEIITKNAGTGKLLVNKTQTPWQIKELIYAQKEIGYTVNRAGEKVSAKSIKVHYGKTGVHAVPYSRWWKK